MDAETKKRIELIDKIKCEIRDKIGHLNCEIPELFEWRNSLLEVCIRAGCNREHEDIASSISVSIEKIEARLSLLLLAHLG